MKKTVFVLILLFFVLGSSRPESPRSAIPPIQIMPESASGPIEFTGQWPYGPCEACAIDAGRNIALIGNGEALQVLDISNPSSPKMIGEAALDGRWKTRLSTN